MPYMVASSPAVHDILGFYARIQIIFGTVQIPFRFANLQTSQDFSPVIRYIGQPISL